GLGSADADTMMEMRYEGYGPSGVAVLVDCLSDNRNRTVSDVRHAFTKYSGNLGTDGSVSYLFDARGEIWLPAGVSEESFMDVAIDAGALDVQQEDDHYLILTNREDYHEIVEKLKTANIEIEHSELCMRPQNKVLLNAEASETLIKLIDMLEDLDDVQYVYTNADFPTEEA
ncbi:MAG: YebC/PmpR family DNA-binding transcriptional regulator, partial [Legionellaceae bacterium]|nr:YebC/PmpR family DNA-binding transcriptional regulator [Legionellaceae bacterium]